MAHITTVEAIAVNLPMRVAFATSKGPVGDPASGRPLVLVRLTDEHGQTGWGESGPVPTWSPETMESVLGAIRSHLGPAVAGRDPADFAGLHAAMDGAIAAGRGRGMPIAKAGIDIAAHDLVGRALGVPLWRLLGRRGGDSVRLAWSLLRPDPAEEVAEARARGYAHFNVKIAGPHGWRADAERILALRHAAPDAVIDADANGGYADHEAAWAARALAAAGADVLEQPLPPHALADSAALRALRILPIALDEGVTAPGELAEAVSLGALDAFVMKVTRTGGLWPLRIASELALAHGLSLLVSGLTDGGIALAASVAIAAAFDVQSPCALVGPQMLAADILATPLRQDGDRVWAPDGPGLGVEVDEERVRRYRLPM